MLGRLDGASCRTLRSGRQDLAHVVAFRRLGLGRTHVHPPRCVLLVWPAISTAVEAYVYYSYLSTMTSGVGNGSKFRLGGWVQTSSKLSPVSAMVQEQARRQLRSQCFNCGSSDHYASKCKAPLHGCTYKCNAVGCGSSILVTSRGQTPPVPSASDAPAPVRKRLASEARHAHNCCSFDVGAFKV